MQLSEAAVLLVDDEAGLLEIFRRWLLLAGCGCVLTAANGEEALARIESREAAGGRIDLLVTDLRMPVMDGASLVRRLSQRSVALPQIIFVSGQGDVDVREMYGRGVEAFLTKPFTARALLAAIQNALAAPNQRWLTPLPVVPRQRLSIFIDDVNPPEDCLRLGRGGFSARCDEPLGLGKVEFHCRLGTGGRELNGQGVVRWRCLPSRLLGVEFVYLDEPSRSWLLQSAELTGCPAFIPAFQAL